MKNREKVKNKIKVTISRKLGLGCHAKITLEIAVFPLGFAGILSRFDGKCF
jgi:hypothetical protein